MSGAEPDTIVALSTPAGTGGVAVVRLSGPKCKQLAIHLTGLAPQRFKPRYAVFAPIRDTEGDEIDRGIVTYFRAPGSYTGEDVLEISSHGGTVIPERIIDACLTWGCVPAQPGEFTRRAFLNGKMDLSQAEAVADMISSSTALSQKISYRILSGRFSRLIHSMKEDLFGVVSLVEAELDFGEDVQDTPAEHLTRSIDRVVSTATSLLNTYTTGRLLTKGAVVSIIGRPNVGKSSLLNALISEDRVIVTDQPGTTRDAVEVTYQIDGLPVRFVDTAGLRDAADSVEARGIEFSHKFIKQSDLVLWVFEGSDSTEDVNRATANPFFEAPHLAVINKGDLLPSGHPNLWQSPLSDGQTPSVVSALKNTGIHALVDRIRSSLITTGTNGREVILTNARHRDALRRSVSNLKMADELLRNNRERDLVAFELREALTHLDTILGITTADDILNHIFATFCIGK